MSLLQGTNFWDLMEKINHPGFCYACSRIGGYCGMCNGEFWNVDWDNQVHAKCEGYAFSSMENPDGSHIEEGFSYYKLPNGKFCDGYYLRKYDIDPDSNNPELNENLLTDLYS